MNRTWQSVQNHRTQDELDFIRGLSEKGNHRALSNYIALADFREWGDMDREACIAAAREGLGR